MKVIVESRNAEGSALRSMAETRLRFVLRRLAWLVRTASVRMSDVNGPRGGIDKQVRVELHVSGARALIVSATSGDWRAAVDAAIGRAARMLARNLRRRRQATPPRLSGMDPEAI